MRKTFLAGLAILATVAGVVCVRKLDEEDSPKPGAVTAGAASGLNGRVLAGDGPVAGARVRIKGHADFALTNAAGRFQLAGQFAEGDVVTAAKDGYLIAALPAAATPLEITLTALSGTDCGGYDWVDPAPSSTVAGACGNCHPAIYEEWQSTGHARSAVNRRFQNLLDGSDWHGDAGHGWGLAEEYPEGVGVCWSCHVPSLDEAAADTDPRHVQGVAAAGVHCDFCHKIRSTNVAQVGLTHGRFAYELLRPAEGQIFFGPLDDVDRGEDAYSPLESESRFCAACHEGTLFGVAVYTTWSEWLASPAAREGRQCQRCHMRPSGTLTNVAPNAGGIERDPATLASHTFMPGGREAMLRGAVDLSFTGVRREDAVEATVAIEARNVGHRLPTGFIDRQLILIVEPFDRARQPAAVLAGPRLPAAVGKQFDGKAGRLFARLLTDADGLAPAPFWRAGVSLADTRLAPDRPESFAFRFSTSTARVRVRLVYRRFWQAVVESKQWPNDDVLVHDRSFAVR